MKQAKKLLIAMVTLLVGSSLGMMVSPLLAHAGWFSAPGVPAGSGLPEAKTADDLVSSVMRVVLAIIGAILVVVLVVLGIRLIFTQEAGARKEIIKSFFYALIGLLIVILAYAIVGALSGVIGTIAT